MSASEPVEWALAERTAVRLARRHRVPMRGDDGLTGQLPGLVARAEELVATETRLLSVAGSAKAIVVDRPAWAARNVHSFRRLMTPFTEQHRERFASSTSRVSQVGLKVGGKVTAVELGALLGWMSARVLGQYEMLMAGDDGSDTVYVVGPNLVDLEERHGFDRDQFRLWIAIHEVTHRAQFTGVPWLRQFFLDQLADVLALGERSSADVVAALRVALADRAEAKRRIADGGLAAVLASDAQRAALHRLAGLMSLLEGHGEVVMNRAAGDLLPAAAGFERVLGERRRRANPLQRLIYRLIGFEAKVQQYAAGSAFIHAIEAEGGATAIDRCWVSPDSLPTLAEIKAPLHWLARVDTGSGPQGSTVAPDRPARAGAAEAGGGPEATPANTPVAVAPVAGPTDLADHGG